MNTPRYVVVWIAALLGFSVPGWAGEKTTVEVRQSVPEEESWAFKLACPVWLAGAWGETGLHGKIANVDVSPATILRHLSFTASVSAEARKGRWGIYADYLYLGDQAGVSTGGLVSKLDLKFTETIADLDVSWRIWETRRGWIELLAGARYMNIYSHLQLFPDDADVEKVSTRLANAAVNDVQRILDDGLKGVLDGRNPVLAVPPLAGDLEKRLIHRIRRAKLDPGLIVALVSGDPTRIALAKARLASNIAGILRHDLSRGFSLNEDWLDPYVGLRARCNLTDAFYLTAKADVGGFGAGSQVSVEAIGAVGCQITRNVWAEAGYKYLYVDYRNDGFVYDVSNGGAMVTIGVNF